MRGSRTENGSASAQGLMREGDTLAGWKLDRLGRSVKNLLDLVGALHQQGVRFRRLTDAIDSGDASGRCFSHFMRPALKEPALVSTPSWHEN